MNLEKETREDRINGIKEEIQATKNEYNFAFYEASKEKTWTDFMETLNTIAKEKDVYGFCVKELLSLGEEFPGRKRKLNYMENRN